MGETERDTADVQEKEEHTRQQTHSNRPTKTLACTQSQGNSEEDAGKTQTDKFRDTWGSVSLSHSHTSALSLSPKP